MLENATVSTMSSVLIALILVLFFQKCSEDSKVKRYYALHTMQLSSVDYNVEDQSGGSTLSLSD